MFDVTDKRAVDRLAAVVVMLEQREATARQEYMELRDQYMTEASPCAGMSAQEVGVVETGMYCAWSRLDEATAALAAAREQL